MANKRILRIFTKNMMVLLFVSPMSDIVLYVGKVKLL